MRKTGNGIWVGLLVIIAMAAACNKNTAESPAVQPFFEPEVPPGFAPVPYPADNRFTYNRWVLGKRLFYDKALSRTQSVSCGSCHLPAFAMGDNRPVSTGVDNRPGTRNAPTLANVAYHPYYTRDGGVPTLEMQVLVPVQEHNEFDFNIIEIQERLKTDPVYDSLSKAAYNRPLDYYVITRALANFERTLLSGRSKYDRSLQQSNLLTPEEERGKALFFSDRTGCSKCHSGFDFSSYAFENNGLYETYPDNGRERLTSLASDRAKFKIPTLRNIAATAPYMHDGSMNSLEEVVKHYNSGGKKHMNKSTLIKPLNLSGGEIADLVRFLETLTDSEFITNKKFRDENNN